MHYTYSNYSMIKKKKKSCHRYFSINSPPAGKFLNGRPCPPPSPTHQPPSRNFRLRSPSRSELTFARPVRAAAVRGRRRPQRRRGRRGRSTGAPSGVGRARSRWRSGRLCGSTTNGRRARPGAGDGAVTAGVASPATPPPHGGRVLRSFCAARPTGRIPWPPASELVSCGNNTVSTCPATSVRPSVRPCVCVWQPLCNRRVTRLIRVIRDGRYRTYFDIDTRFSYRFKNIRVEN